MSESKTDYEEEKTKIEQLKLKNKTKDTRVKTEDVTKTKGLSFEDFGLSSDLQLAIYEMGYEKPSPVQEESIPIILQGKNVIGKAKTGTGKTGAYAIPAINMIDQDSPDVQVLIIVPTRELALQTSATMKKFASYLNLEIMASLGGTSIRDDILRLEKTVHIIVATPGRILDLAEKSVVDLSTLKIVILDEVDKLLSTHFMPVTEQLFEYMREDVQVLLFSATFPKESTKEFQK